MKINKDRRLFFKKALSTGSGVCTSTFVGKHRINYSLQISRGGDNLTFDPSTVIIAHNDNLFEAMGVVKEIPVAYLLHKDLMQLTNTTSKEKAWQSLFKLHDIVGIKLNC